MDAENVGLWCDIFSETPRAYTQNFSQSETPIPTSYTSHVALVTRPEPQETSLATNNMPAAFNDSISRPTYYPSGPEKMSHLSQTETNAELGPIYGVGRTMDHVMHPTSHALNSNTNALMAEQPMKEQTGQSLHGGADHFQSK